MCMNVPDMQVVFLQTSISEVGMSQSVTMVKQCQLSKTSSSFAIFASKF